MGDFFSFSLYVCVRTAPYNVDFFSLASIAVAYYFVAKRRPERQNMGFALMHQGVSFLFFTVYAHVYFNVDAHTKIVY